jgi:hypothetical protein
MSNETGQGNICASRLGEKAVVTAEIKVDKNLWLHPLKCLMFVGECDCPLPVATDPGDDEDVMPKVQLGGGIGLVREVDGGLAAWIVSPASSCTSRAIAGKTCSPSS